MDEPYVAGVEGDAAVGVGAWGAVFEVTFYYAPYCRELGPYLVVAAGEEFNFQEEVPFCGGEEFIAQAGLFCPLFWGEAGVGLVLLFVSGKIVCEEFFILFGAVAYNCPICLVHLSCAECLIQAPKGFGGLGKDYGSAYRAVETVHHTHKYGTGLVVPLGHKSLEGCAQALVLGFVCLHNLSGAFIENKQVVVLIEDPACYIIEFLLSHCTVHR